MVCTHYGFLTMVTKKPAKKNGEWAVQLAMPVLDSGKSLQVTASLVANIYSLLASASAATATSRR